MSTQANGLDEAIEIKINQAQYELLCEIFNELAGLDLPPAQDENFDPLWDAVIAAEQPS